MKPLTPKKLIQTLKRGPTVLKIQRQYNETDIESNTFEKFFKANDVSTIDNSWRTATIFSEEESLKNEIEKFHSDELIY